MAIKDLAVDVARKAKRVAGKVVDALEGSGKTHVVSERCEAFRLPMPDGIPLVALLKTKRMRTTYDALKDPSEYTAYEICTADDRGCTISAGPGSPAMTIGHMMSKATDGFYQLRVTTSALSCQECAGCGIVRNDRCAACDGSGNRSVRDCIRHIALNLQKTVPGDDHDALLHVAMSAMRETDEFYTRLVEQTKAHSRHEHMDGLRACVIFYLGAMARVSSIGPVPQFKEMQTTQPFHARINLLSRAAAAAGMYASLVVTHLAASAYHRSESARLLTLLGLESRSGGLTVDSLGMTIFTEVRPDGITVQDVWSPEFFRKVMDDCGTSLQGDLFADYAQRVNQITWTIESTAQTAGMLPGESLAAFIERLRLERNEALDKLSEVLSTLNGQPRHRTEKTMNAKTMKVVLESTEQSTRAICNLKELLAESAARIDNLKRLIGCGNMDAEQTERAIKDMIAERSELLSVHRQNIALTSVLDAVGELPRESGETTTAYAARLAKVFVARSDAAAEYQALAEKRLNDLAELHIKLAKLETRESELIALHDAIEYLSGFPMQPQESYAAYLQRLAAANKLNDERATAMDNHLQAIEKAILKADAFRKLPKESFAEYVTRLAADRARLAADLEHLTASTQATTQRLRAQLDGNNQQYAESRATIANLEAQLVEASKERDNFRARWEESLSERDRAVDEARQTSEANQALQGEVTLRSQILARIMIDPSTDKLFNERDWNAAARKVLIEARGIVSDEGTVTK